MLWADYSSQDPPENNVMSQRKEMRKKVFHFVPSMDIGGVEVGIQRSLPDLRKRFDISIFYVKGRGSLCVGQFPWWRALKNLFKDKPEIVVTSLWWAHPFGMLFSFAGARWVCFMHNAGLTHVIDRLVCRAAVRMADEVAADSNATVQFVRKIKKDVKAQAIPYFFQLDHEFRALKRIPNSFIFVGRGTAQKRIDLVAEFFGKLLASFPDVTCRFVIAGECSKDVWQLAAAYRGRVTVENDLPNQEVIRRLCASEYFVVLSDYEGFCMAAHEAVQAGCFVIYRDVGEIRNYVVPGMSFMVRDITGLAAEFSEFLKGRTRVHTASETQESRQQASRQETYSAFFIDLIAGMAGTNSGRRAND